MSPDSAANGIAAGGNPAGTAPNVQMMFIIPQLPMNAT